MRKYATSCIPYHASSPWQEVKNSGERRAGGLFFFFLDFHRFKIFGLIYAVVAVMGFVVGNGMIFGLISNNTNDTWLHVVLAVAMLAIGFLSPKAAAVA